MDYGKGYYSEGKKHLEGRIVVDASRLYVAGERDYASTYVPLEKIEKIRHIRGGLEVSVKFSAANRVKIVVSLPGRSIRQLTKDLVERLHLKKVFLKREWCGEPAWR